eukprot:SAG22_NODE_4053_length_1404_cov_1.580843_3_plen_134_part_00
MMSPPSPFVAVLAMASNEAELLKQTGGDPAEVAVIPKDALQEDGGAPAAAAVAAASEDTPMSRFFAKLDEATEAVPGSVGRMIIRGVLGEPDDDGEQDDDGDEIDEEKAATYTEEEVGHMRWIIVTKSRCVTV